MKPELLFSVVQLLSFVLECCYAVNPLTATVVNGVSGQENPCLGQDIVYECTFESGATGVDMRVTLQSGETSSLTVLPSRRILGGVFGGSNLTANLTSDTSAQLLISPATSMINGSTLSCEPLSVTGSQSISIIVLGSASAATFMLNSITQISFNGLRVPVLRPTYGWECLGTYNVMVTAQTANGGDTVSESVTVSNLEQLSTVVSLSGMDMCRNEYNLTAVAISSGQRGEEFTRTYQADASALGSVVINSTTTVQPLTTPLSWSLSSLPQPPDCVTNYTVTFNGKTFNTSDSFVSPNDLTSNGFPSCKNQAVNISPSIPTLGRIDSSSATVTVRTETGFQLSEVVISDFQLHYNFTVQLMASFRVSWVLTIPSDAQMTPSGVTVGFSTGMDSCVPNYDSSHTDSHTFSVPATQQFMSTMLVLTGCVHVRNGDCVGDASSSQQFRVPIISGLITARPENEFQITVTNSEDIVNIDVSITPGDVVIDTSQVGDNYIVTITGLRDDTVYSFRIQALGENNTPVGVPITGTYQIPDKPPPCGTGCIIGIVVAVVFVVLAIVVIALCIIFRDKIRKCCCPDIKEDTDTHELKSPTDRNSIEHEQGPGGEEYAVVATSAKTKKPVAADALYQDPNTIEHKQGPETGDLYAVTEKKPQKKSNKTEEKSDEELAAMYSVPDKTKRGQQGLTYASIDVGPGDSNKRVNPPPQTEYSTVVY